MAQKRSNRSYRQSVREAKIFFGTCESTARLKKDRKKAVNDVKANKED